MTASNGLAKGSSSGRLVGGGTGAGTFTRK